MRTLSKWEKPPATTKLTSPWAEEENVCSDLRAVDMGVMGLSRIQAVEPRSSGSWAFLRSFQDVNAVGSCEEASALSWLKGGERIPLRFASPSGHLLCLLKPVKNVASSTLSLPFLAGTVSLLSPCSPSHLHVLTIAFNPALRTVYTRLPHYPNEGWVCTTT